jgi:hypothetical protein
MSRGGGLAGIGMCVEGDASWEVPQTQMLGLSVSARCTTSDAPPAYSTRLGPLQHSTTGGRRYRKYKATFHASLFHRPRAHPPCPPAAWCPRLGSARTPSAAPPEARIARGAGPISAHLPLFPHAPHLLQAAFCCLSGRAQARCASQVRTVDS